MQDQYQVSNNDQNIQFTNLYDLEEAAKAVIDKGAFGYIAGEAGDEWTLRENIKAFDHRLIVPEVLTGIDQVDQTTEIFGDQVSTPIILAPLAAMAWFIVEQKLPLTKEWRPQIPL